MAPKIGLQTIIWGEEFEGSSIADALDLIRDAGYEGVEFAQSRRVLGDPVRLEAMLEERGLTLLGLAHDSLLDRANYCQGMAKKPLYLYVEDWYAGAAPQAIEMGFTLGLHPFQFSTVDRLDRALPLLQAHPELKFIPDTGHLWLAGDDLIRVLESTRDRLIAVHLKDWRPDYGRESTTYARGFTELGCGIVPLKPVWDWLEKHFDGWVVVEQDSTERETIDSIRMSWDWLHGEQCSSTVCASAPMPLHLPEALQPQDALTARPEDMVAILDVMHRDSARGIERLYATILDCFGRLVPCKACALWEVSPRIGHMTLQRIWPEDPRIELDVTAQDLSHPISGMAARSREICVFEHFIGRAREEAFGNASVVEALGLDTLVSVPILNTYNMHQVQLVVNLFPQRWPARNSDEEQERLREIKALARHVTVSVERAWDAVRSHVIDEISYVAGSSKTVQEMLDAILERVQMHARCQAVSVFLVSAARDRLVMVATTGIEGQAAPKSVTYGKGEGLPGEVWEYNESRTSRRASLDERDDERPMEAVEGSPQSLLLMPIRDPLGEVIGLVRCRGKLGQHGSDLRFFSLTDEVALAALCSALSPHLVRMIANERRSRAITRITHELKVPIHVTLGAVEFTRHEMKRRGWRLSRDYLGDIEDYMHLMRALVAKASALRPDVEMTLNRSRRVFLLRDVFTPAIRQVRALLEQRRFSGRRISYNRVGDLPPLYVDKTRFEQIVFNLLSNAIKFAYRDPGAFQVEVIGRKARGGFEIVFRDWGPGIDEGMEELIFEEGVRGPNAHQLDVAGDGVGCWLVREIIKAHGGTVTVTSARHPTEFTIWLPASLEIPPRPEQR